LIAVHHERALARLGPCERICFSGILDGNFDSRCSRVVQSRGGVSRPGGFADGDSVEPIVATLLIATRGTLTAIPNDKGGSTFDL
jgi:hypothetical protein